MLDKNYFFNVTFLFIKYLNINFYSFKDQLYWSTSTNTLTTNVYTTRLGTHTQLYMCKSICIAISYFNFLLNILSLVSSGQHKITHCIRFVIWDGTTLLPTSYLVFQYLFHLSFCFPSYIPSKYFFHIGNPTFFVRLLRLCLCSIIFNGIPPSLRFSVLLGTFSYHIVDNFSSQTAVSYTYYTAKELISSYLNCV